MVPNITYFVQQKSYNLNNTSFAYLISSNWRYKKLMSYDQSHSKNAYFFLFLLNVILLTLALYAKSSTCFSYTGLDLLPHWVFLLDECRYKLVLQILYFHPSSKFKVYNRSNTVYQKHFTVFACIMPILSKLCKNRDRYL